MHPTAAYLFIWLFALIGAVLYGFLANYIHGNFQAYPDKLVDGETFQDRALNEFLSPEYRWYGTYTLEGWWDHTCNRNLAIHVLPAIAFVLVVGLYNWPERYEAVQLVCQKAHAIAVEPRLCLGLEKAQ